MLNECTQSPRWTQNAGSPTETGISSKEVSIPFGKMAYFRLCKLKSGESFTSWERFWFCEDSLLLLSMCAFFCGAQESKVGIPFLLSLFLFRISLTPLVFVKSWRTMKKKEKYNPIDWQPSRKSSNIFSPITKQDDFGSSVIAIA
jgi:hypothetical protein